VNRPLRRLVALLFAGIATAAAFAVWPASRDVRTEDRDGDGRADVWRMYDRRGELVELAVDSNFDGRSDVREYYALGALVRRESDRTFSGRVDLIEEFDSVTHERVRSVVDTDDDGTADLLVLFRAGEPVFTKEVAAGAVVPDTGWLARDGVSPGPVDDSLVPLRDPFSGDAAIRQALLAASATGDRLWIGVGLPAGPCLVETRITPTSDLDDLAPQSIRTLTLSQRSPRGPPFA
jgi:hypothetical protein